MTLRSIFVGLIFMTAALPGLAQLRLQVPFPQTTEVSEIQGNPFGMALVKQVQTETAVFLPRHVRENPRGYSPLCRLELRIEDELPVGMWVKLGPNKDLTYAIRSNAEVRFKLFKF